MANKGKLTPEILNKLKILASEGYNHTAMAGILNFKRQTVDYWVKKYNIQTNRGKTRDNYLNHLKLLGIFKVAFEQGKFVKINQALKELDLHSSEVQKILNKYPQYKSVIRSRQQAALEDRTLPLKEAQSRLPNQEDKVIGFEDGRYKIQALDGFVYYKKSSKLSQGDPRNKCGSKIQLSEIKSKLKTIGYTLLEESYTIKRRSLKAVHDKCGKVRINRFSNFFKQDCPVCSITGVSKAEQELDEWVQSLGFETQKLRFKGKTKGKEIDIYIPSLNLGIEYCGLYWHNEVVGNKSRNYHYDKMKMANQQDIRLITIFEDEWLERQIQVKNFLKSVLGVIDRRIFARKCYIKEVEKPTAQKFLDQNHIQGSAQLKIAFGLYYNDELLGLVTGNNHHRKRDGLGLVLNRLVFKDGVQIVGGASKLLKHLVQYGKINEYEKIISWSDNRWSEGRVYKSCGFTLENELKPDYSYALPTLSKRESKQSNKKKCLLRKGAVGNMTCTERELALTLGLHRIWDCGKKRWVINLVNIVSSL